MTLSLFNHYVMDKRVILKIHTDICDMIWVTLTMTSLYLSPYDDDATSFCMGHIIWLKISCDSNSWIIRMSHEFESQCMIHNVWFMAGNRTTFNLWITSISHNIWVISMDHKYESICMIHSVWIMTYLGNKNLQHSPSNSTLWVIIACERDFYVLRSHSYSTPKSWF